MTQSKIVLASTSSIRKILLANSGLIFNVEPSPLDETEIKQANPTLSAKSLSILLAEQKALALNQPENLVIGTDQTLSCDNQIYSKAKTVADLRHQLLQLRGNTHALSSSVALAKNNHILWTHCSESQLTMRQFSDQFLDHYIEHHGKTVLSSLGGYQLEAQGINLFEKIEGDYFAILGLPLLPLLAYLRQENYVNS